MKHFAWILVAVLGCRSAAPDGPGLVQRFYAEVRTAGVTGAPSPEQLTRLAPFLGDTLELLLAQARQQHDADAARAPNDKPSFADGDLFSSLFEGPTSVRTEPGMTSGETSIVLAHMSRDSATSWTDTVIVGSESGFPVIEDIRYGGTWDFALKGSLRAQLSGARAGAP
jgi:hypothetical protein